MSDNKEKSTPQTKKPILVKKLNPVSSITNNPNPSSDNKETTPVFNNTNVETSVNSVTKVGIITSKINQVNKANEVNKAVSTTKPSEANKIVATSKPSEANKNRVITSVATPKNAPRSPNKIISSPTPKVISIAPAIIDRQMADDSLTKSSLDLTIKIYEVPKEVNTNAQGSKEFFVTANDRQVFISVKAKQFNKLIEAQEKWTSWIARISGKFGSSTRDGFILEQPNIQVFEKPAKTEPTLTPTNATNSSPTNSKVNSTTENNDNLPLTNKQYKEICKLFDPYLSKGKLPNQTEIAAIWLPYNLHKEAKKTLLRELIFRNKVDRPTAFLIETLYFKLLANWDKTYKKLMDEIAQRLEMNQVAVERWISFIHTTPSYVRKIALPEESVIKEVIDKYHQYLSSDTLPEQGLHSLISKSVSIHLNKDQVHKILATYRQKLRQDYFDKQYSPTVQTQPTNTNADTEEPKVTSTSKNNSTT